MIIRGGGCCVFVCNAFVEEKVKKAGDRGMVWRGGQWWRRRKKELGEKKE